MDIKLTDSAIRNFVDTSADSETLSSKLSLCGPTFDRTLKVDNDCIYDIEIITNRIDTVSAFGIAREAVAILNQLHIPAKLTNDPYKLSINKYPNLPPRLKVNIDTQTAIRFAAITIDHVNVRPSPSETVKLLERCGLRPINNLIDITNELTILYGLPCHIFDLDKLAIQSLHIRHSRQDETITTLDGQKHGLSNSDIVIEDGAGRLVDLCGIMGGQVAEVDDHTKNILFIVPVYEPKLIRKTSIRLQTRTLAAQIFEKLPDEELVLPVLTKGIELFQERSGGEPSSQVLDHHPKTQDKKSVRLDFNWLNTFIGTELTNDTVIAVLNSLGFSGRVDDHSIICNVPSWRYHDINIKEDLAEEVARIYGYFRLPAKLPNVITPPEPSHPTLQVESIVKNFLVASNYHEVYNNSLTSHQLLADTNLDPAKHLKLQNALSSDFEYLRTSLAPSLLSNLEHNQGKWSSPVRIFEIANTYHSTTGALPKELSQLALLTTEDYRTAKGAVENLLRKLHLSSATFMSATNAPAYYDHLAVANITYNDQPIGHLGMIKPEILQKLGLSTNPVVCELKLATVSTIDRPRPQYIPVSEYPPIYEDFTVKSNKAIGDIISFIKHFSPLIQDTTYTGSYHNNHSFRITFASYDRNLDQSEVNSIREQIRQQISN